MAVKNLKIIFRKIVLNTNKFKLIRELLVSVSIDRTHLLSIATKLIWLAVLSSNYWLYEFNDTRFQKIKKKLSLMAVKSLKIIFRKFFFEH